MRGKKRPPGEGSVYQRGDGRWVASRTVGATAAGHPRRLQAYGRTQAEARRKLETKIEELGGPAAARALPRAGGVTLKRWSETWLKLVAEDGLKPLTLATFERVLRLHILPTLGQRPLHALLPAHVSDLLTALSEKLSPVSRRLVKSVLSQCLARAVALGVIRSNPCLEVRSRGRSPRFPVWKPQDVARFLASARERSRLWPLYHLLLVTGLRRGELLALRWSDLDMDAGTLTVRATFSGVGGDGAPKSASSRRTIPLDPETVSILGALRERYDLEQRVAVEAQLEQGAWEHVASTSTGARLYPMALQRDWEASIAAAEVPRIRLHDCRHTSATLALRAGIAPHVVARRLGHSSAVITMKIYAHVLDDQQQAAALPLAAMLLGPQQEDTATPAN